MFFEAIKNCKYQIEAREADEESQDSADGCQHAEQVDLEGFHLNRVLHPDDVQAEASIVVTLVLAYT